MKNLLLALLLLCQPSYAWFFVKAPSGGGISGPGDLPGLVMDFDPDDGSKLTFSSGTKVATFASSDLVSSLVAARTVAAQQPDQITGVLNGKGILRSNANHEIAMAGALGGSGTVPDTGSSFSLFIIHKFSAISSTNYWDNTLLALLDSVGGMVPYLNYDATTTGLYVWNQAGQSYSFPATPGTSAFHLVNFNYAGGGQTTIGNYSAQFDKVAQTLSTYIAGGATNPSLMGFGQGAYGLNGDGARWVVYQPALSAGDITKFNNWVLATFGI